MPEVGLSSGRAAELLAEYGPNIVPTVARVPAWRQLLAQFWHFFALMLWVAALLAVLAGMPQLAIAIALVIVVNGLFAFIQEFRAERAADALRELMPARVTAVRDGHRMVLDAAQVVPGDVILLDEGDRIAADMRCLDGQGLRIDSSTLTGESLPESAEVGDGLYAGTFVVQGRGRAQVVKTGAGTRFAQISQLSASRRRPRTPLERDIRSLVRTIAVIAATTGTVFFIVMVALGVPVSEGFLFGIGVTVALVPEGLLPTVTLSLAIGAQRMAARNALVRRLESVETLGATTVICSDKTGTITENRMNIVAAWTPLGAAEISGEGYATQASVRCPDAALPAVREVAAVARMASQGQVRQVDGKWVVHGDPMDAAVVVLARRLSAEPLDVHGDYVPFDPSRRTAEFHSDLEVLCKGAPESVFARIPEVPVEAHECLHDYTRRGLRVLAVARGPASNLRLCGLLAFEDPPRVGVAEAIADCRRAGIKVIMMTGDHPRTARSIAEEVGLADPGDSRVLTGDELPQTHLEEVVDHDGLVLARITPEDKLRVAQALRTRGHVVAMTGDGVNDAPALREADIGVAMGQGGTDVAREVADLVLLDNHFSSVVAAVIQGRGTFINARRFLTYHLTDNVAELAPFMVWAASLGNIPLALGVLQILALDLGTDTLPAIALGAEKPDRRVLDHSPVSGGLLDRTVAVRAFGVLGPTEAVVEMLVFFGVLGSGGSLMAASGSAFLVVVVMQAANSFACRGVRQPVWRLPWTSNRFLLAAVAASMTFGVACLTIPAVQGLLGGTWPPWGAVVAAVVAVPLLWLVDAAAKWVFHRGVGRFDHGGGDRAQVPRG